MFIEFCQFLGTLLQYTDQLRSFYIALCVVNALSSIFSTVFNLLVLSVIKRSSSLHSPSYVLLSTLAFSDLAIGCVVQPLYIAFRVADLTGASTVYCGLGIVHDFLGNSFGALSFLVITSISVDRFLALYLHGRYRVMVTRKRAQVLTLVLGISSAIYGLSSIIDRRAYYVLGIILGPLFIVITSLNYLNSNRLVRKHRQRSIRRYTQQSRQKYGTLKREIAMIRYKHTLKTLLYVFILFLLCYLPFIFSTLVHKTSSRNEAIQISMHISVTIVFINSSLNPMLYCWRIPEIRKAVRQILRLDKQDVLNTVDGTRQLKIRTEVNYANVTQHLELRGAATTESGC